LPGGVIRYPQARYGEGVSLDVVVIGAGMAGLCTALWLVDRGMEVAVVEAGDTPGGRVRTDKVDGYLLDRGFQLYNPAYPEGRRLLDYRALNLRPYIAGVAVALDGTTVRLADPRRRPSWALRSATADVGGIAGKLRFAAMMAQVGYRRAANVLAGPDTTTEAALRGRGIPEPLVERVLRPFLAGVFGEDELRTSRRYCDLVLRSFVRGTPCLPAAGMGSIPAQLASRLPSGVLRVTTPAVELRGTTVLTPEGSLDARVVVVATDAAAANGLLPGLPMPPMNGLTTFYHRAPLWAIPPVLHVDGLRRGPVVNTSAITAVAASYGPGTHHLIASTVVGNHDNSDTEHAVRQHLSVIYRRPTAAWAHLRTYALPHALPAMMPPLNYRQPVALGDGIFVAGDHRDTSSLQGAMVSGRRAAAAVLDQLGA
jgi:phytoene dehydrogenase-like protein